MDDDEMTTVYDAHTGEPVQVRVLDLLNPAMPRASREVRGARLEACKSCHLRIGPGIRCSSCGCAMQLKTWLEPATCPEGKWSA